MPTLDINGNTLIKCISEKGEASVTLPNGITVIGKDALCGLKNITSVTLPNSLKSISDGAFYGCSSLTSIILPDGVERLGSCAFAQCESLQSIRLNDKLTEIGNSAFWGCKSLECIAIPCGVTNIGYNLFGGCLSLASVTLPDGIKELDERSFKECTSLKYISLPNGLRSIGNMAFLNCHSLKSIIIPDTVESIGEKSFFMCENLTELTVFDGVTAVGGDAFADCKSVTVRSKVSGKPLYKAVTATDGSAAYNFILRNIWGKNGFDFSAQDSYFPALTDRNLQYEIAFSRLMYKVAMNDKSEESYLDFLHDNAEEAVCHCIDTDNDEMLKQCEELGLLTSDNISRLVSYADKHGNTALTAILLDMSEKFRTSDSSAENLLSDLEL